MSLFRCGGGEGASDLVGVYEDSGAFFNSNKAEAQLNDLVVNGENALRTAYNTTKNITLTFGTFSSSANTTSFTVTSDCALYFGIAGTNVTPNISNNKGLARYMFPTDIHLGEFNVTTPVTTGFACFKAGDKLTLNTSGQSYVGFKVGVYGKAI